MILLLKSFFIILCIMNVCLSINRISTVRYYSTPIFRTIRYNKYKNTFNNLKNIKNTTKKNTNTNSNTMYNNNYKNKYKNKHNRKYKSYDSYKNMYSGLPGLSFCEFLD